LGTGFSASFFFPFASAAVFLSVAILSFSLI
jgi:hypothetical protein